MCKGHRAAAYSKKHRERLTARKLELRLLDPQRQMWRSAKQRAKQLGIPFDIEISDVVIPENCPYLGFPLVRGHRFSQDDSPSLDKINPDLGYVRGNVQVISYMANSMKRNATPEQLLLFSRSVVRIHSPKPKG